jgi:thiamine-phosphate pyrophosphorylase
MLFGGICFITDRTISACTVEDQVRTVLDEGVNFIQYREKHLSRRDLYFHAEKLRKITYRYGATYIVNDHCDVALAVGADGVHLGQDDLPLLYAKKIMKNRIIGISTHSLEQAMNASAAGASYIGFGPIYHTATKDAGIPQGPQKLKEIKDNITIPVVAIGGIGLENLMDLFRAGADAVAIASAILKADDVPGAAMAFTKAIQKCGH